MGKNILGGPGQPPFGVNGVPNMKINPDDCPIMECTRCGHDTFIELVHFRAVSPLLIPPGGGYITTKRCICGKCALDINLELSRRWAAFSIEDRIKARENHNKHIEENKA